MDDLHELVRSAAGRAEVREAIERIYADVAAAIDARRPRCEASGRCCRFDEYGHRLYVTTMELAVFVDSLRESHVACSTSRVDGMRAAAATGRVSLSVLGRADGGGCRFQVGGLCSVHPIRPFGCRMFYCDPEAEAWQQAQYEHFHARLKAEHERLGVEYRYVEWRSALRAVMGDE